MEKELAGIPILQKTKATRSQPVEEAASCCAKPANATVCCTPHNTGENSDVCCDQPADGSACCDK